MPINSIEVHIHLNYKFNFRLSNLIILSFYIQSTLNCIMTSSGHAYFQRSALCNMPWSRLLWTPYKSIFGKKIALRVQGLQARGITLSSFQRCQWKANVTGVPTCHYFPRFVIVSEKSVPEVGNRWLRSSQNWGFLGKNTPYGQIFTNVPKPAITPPEVNGFGWVYGLELSLANFGRDPRRSGFGRKSRNFVFFVH